jgi:hypothetical protein
MNSPAFIAFTFMLGVRFCLAAPSTWLGPGAPGRAYPPGEEDRQFAMISRDLQQRAHFQRVSGQSFRREALIWETDRDPLDVILRRMEALLTDIRRSSSAPDLSVAANELANLRIDAEKTAVTETQLRRNLFDRACRIRRRAIPTP